MKPKSEKQLPAPPKPDEASAAESALAKLANCKDMEDPAKALKAQGGFYAAKTALLQLAERNRQATQSKGQRK